MIFNLILGNLYRTMNVWILFPQFDKKIHEKKDPGQILIHLSKIGHNAKMVCYRKRSNEVNIERIDGAQIVKLKPGFIHILYHLIKNRKHIDCIIGYHGRSILYGLLFKLIKRKGIFVIKMDTDGSYAIKKENIIRSFYRYLTHILFFYFTDFIIVESPKAKNRIIKRYFWLKSKVLVIQNGIDIDTYEKLKKKLKNSLKLKKDKMIILFVGSVIPRKGLDLLIKAYSILKKEYPNWIVRVVGDTKVDIQYKNQLDELIRKEGLEGKVIFVGRISEKKASERIHDCRRVLFAIESRRI